MKARIDDTWYYITFFNDKGRELFEIKMKHIHHFKEGIKHLLTESQWNLLHSGRDRLFKISSRRYLAFENYMKDNIWN